MVAAHKAEVFPIEYFGGLVEMLEERVAAQVAFEQAVAAESNRIDCTDRHTAHNAAAPAVAGPAGATGLPRPEFTPSIRFA